MAIIYQGIILLFVFSLATAQTSLPNPECRGMNTAARHLQTALKSIPLLELQGSAKATCNPTKQCSGVICTWSSNSILEVDLRYCEDPVNYYVHFKDQGFSVDKNLTIGEKGEQVLYKKHKFVMIKIKVTELRRIENKVTTSVVLVVCSIASGCKNTPLLPWQAFCVRMDKCPGFNASVDHYKPCSYTSTPTTFISSSRWPALTTDPPLSLRSSSSGPHPHFPGNGPSSGLYISSSFTT
ncbi:PREDICTED: uncharacterized protein LOC107358714 [Acropora digitifera]|uniref:uncharacterized protein LOC107358714 n=1 Tax=Acropora digitifera TaxID=70779 RepID=UPI00077AABF9|nr:PREDICTED: uncharacterized protein LOC107358714 [Acropora digitifera]